jgi:hypothetical protein
MKANMAVVRIISFTTRLPAEPNRQVTPDQQTLSGFAIADGTGAMAIATIIIVFFVRQCRSCHLFLDHIGRWP